MKKTILIVLLLVICISVIAVLNPKNINKNRIDIITSFYPIYTAVINLTDGIPGVVVTNLTNEVTGCVHDYVLSPKELVKVSKADVLVINGNGMEAFISKVMEQTDSLKIIDSGKGVIKQYVVHDKHEEVDPHTYLDINNYILQVKNIANELINIDFEYKELYEKNLQKYLSKLHSFKQDSLDLFKELSVKVVCQSNSFKYFANGLGIQVLAVVEKEEGEAPSLQEMSKIIEIIDNNNVNIFIADKDIESSTADTVLKETSIKECEFNKVLFGTSSKDDYINIMTKNVESLFNIVKETVNGQV